jgi:acetyl esterase/lipase
MKIINAICPIGKNATLRGLLVDTSLTYGQQEKRPAVLICPGGGYMYVAPREAEPMMHAFAAKGFHAFVLYYSCGMDGGDFVQEKQLAWALSLLRAKREEWGIDPEQIISVGFSAGGHLALSGAIYAEEKPNALILGYPLLSFHSDNEEMKKGMGQLLNILLHPGYTEDDADRLELIQKIDGNIPPLFLFNTWEDTMMTAQTLGLLEKYMQLHRPYEYHCFQQGPHGLALGDETTANGSSQMFNPHVGQWFDLCIDWLKQTLLKPELVDKKVTQLV